MFDTQDLAEDFVAAHRPVIHSHLRMFAPGNSRAAACLPGAAPASNKAW
jgi:hypothetical protein